MFAAQAGAKHVYAIDMSDILTDAREIVRKNGFADKITLFQGKVEDIKLPVSFTVSAPLCRNVRSGGERHTLSFTFSVVEWHSASHEHMVTQRMNTWHV